MCRVWPEVPGGVGPLAACTESWFEVVDEEELPG